VIGAVAQTEHERKTVGYALKRGVQKCLNLFGYAITRSGNLVEGIKLYNQDGLISWHNHSFMQQPEFLRAYQRGLEATKGIDPRHHWRVHTAIWAASVALSTDGDFVECGVNAGFISSAIMKALNWNSQGRDFYLVDSFAGPPMNQFSQAEVDSGLEAKALDAIERGAFVTDMDRVRSNFAEWPAARIVQGYVPEVLPLVASERIAFVHLDLNAAFAEKEALEYFWPRISRGGVVLLDDYAHAGYEPLHAAIDGLGMQIGFSALSLPTGQGVIVKERGGRQA